LIGSIIAFAAAIILVIVVMNKGGDDTGDATKTTAAGAAGNTSGGTSAGKAGSPAKAGAAGTAPQGSTAAGHGAALPDEPTAKPVHKKPVHLGRLKLEKFSWPDEVDAETRTQVDEAIQNLYRGGRDGKDAAEFLISKGRVVCGRIVSEFRTIEESPGFQSRDGASMCGAIDNLLRRIDGVIERKFYEENHIRASSQPSFITGIAKRWVWWWSNEEWKNTPREPYDPFSESIESIKEAAKAKKHKKTTKKGFGKRAGG